ncbi:nuclear envelope integral membrane protein 1-like [Pollicipes pollicipes]|uniref:nuclear envelope integral membrane protein 1-like n=1 Tax=Pollicipes pollicipes TaxID=41117 RepID=UPI00188525C4|nr:nuclear envelope integral membrane protein 1-like [Pollicipes pollicipes]
MMVIITRPPSVRIHCWQVLLFLLLSAVSGSSAGPAAPKEHGKEHEHQSRWSQLTLHPGKNISSEKLHPDAVLATYCYAGEAPSLAAVWKTLWLSLSIDSDRFVVYRGDNATDVLAQHKATSSQLFNLLPWRTRHVRLPTFATTCVGVETVERYSVQLNVRHVDYSLVLLLAAGLALFLCADALSTNVVFHYSSGVAVGMFGAILVAVYVLSRMIPRRGGAWAFLFTGWSLTLYLLQYVLENLRQHVIRYKAYVLGYLAVSGLISFAICYWNGPVKDRRTQTLIKWFLQLVGLACVYLSSNLPEASMAVVLMLLGWQAVPAGVSARVRAAVRHRLYRPRPRRLLTEQEYLEQSSAATRQALDELRQYCRSPDCDAWRTVSRLRTPTRFAEFVEGSSHLSDAEVLEYELEPTTLLPSDGEDLSADEW